MENSTHHPAAPMSDSEERSPEASNEVEEERQSMPIEIDVHGIKAKFYLNTPLEEMFPSRYARKAENSLIVNYVPWIFRSAQDAREVSTDQWSKEDIRFRGVFQTLKKVPQFVGGIYDEDGGCLADGASAENLDEAIQAQAQVVYAFLDELLDTAEASRQDEKMRPCFYLRPRLISVEPEYWTGYRKKHKDCPVTGGSVCVDFNPRQNIPRTIFHVSMTLDEDETLESSLEGQFKMLLAQLLHHLHRRTRYADKLPDQEVYLLGIHGSRLHLLRAIFPGQKTSKAWCGRHNPHLPDPIAENLQRLQAEYREMRFYSPDNLDRIQEKMEWRQVSNPDNEADSRTFQVLGSKEYDLLIKSDFREAVKMIVGLVFYLMSGHSHCGILQGVFEIYPYDEDKLPHPDEQIERREELAKQLNETAQGEKKLEELEKKKPKKEKQRFWQHDSMRNTSKDRIKGFLGPSRLWEWVWDDGADEKVDDKDTDFVVGGP